MTARTNATGTTAGRFTQGLRRAGIVGAVVGLSALSAGAADAQGRGRGAKKVPPGHLPSAGECRVWHDNRPPGQQPSPTSCANAEADAARNGGRVLYGDDTRRKGKKDVRGDDRRDDRRDDDRRGDRRDDGRRTDRCDERDRSGCEWHEIPGRTYPTSLPDMDWGVLFGRGSRVNEVRQWVGPNDVRARYTDADRNGRPEAVTWTDAAGRIVQQWVDDNRDGRADRVSLYQNNRVVRVIK